MSRRKSSKKNKQTFAQGPGKSTRNTTPVFPPLHSRDAALWAEVTKSLTPLKNSHDRLHFGPLLDEKPSLPSQWRNTASRPSNLRHRASGNGSSGASGQKAPTNYREKSSQTTGEMRPLPDLGSFSRREIRQISSGRQSIEARLDLHGMRQAAAHAALRGFLMQSQSKGLRHVLVITGKGRSSPREDLLFAGQEPGVLRRVVPLWLSEPDLRAIITGFSQAPQRHGGEGALYVRLRRNR
jgi:DNA-nicking Smr family endonuclease